MNHKRQIPMKTISTIILLLILIPCAKGVLVRVFLYSDPYLGESNYYFPCNNGIGAYPSEDNVYGRYVLFPGPTRRRILSNEQIVDAVESENLSSKWMLMIGVSIACGLTIRRIMIRQVLYREIPTTRLIELED